MKKIISPIIMLLLAGYAMAQVKHTVSKSAITFKIKNLGINTDGSFSNLQANILFDPNQLASSTIEATVDATSVNTDNEMRDKHLKSDSFFDVEKYPKISMKSASFKHKSGDNYIGEFNVTIKDKTKLIEMPFTYTKADSTATFKGTMKLQRSDFGVGGSSLVLSNDVYLTIEVSTKI